jgi:hyaluronate lyase
MQRASLVKTGLLLAALQSCLLHAPARADTFDDMLAKWRQQSSSAPALPPTNMEPPAPGGSDAAATYWNTMILAPDRTTLWADLPLGAVSANVTAHVRRLITLANAYKSPASPYYRNAVVLKAVLDGMDWFVAKVYKAGSPGYDNSWDWDLGTGMQMGLFMTDLYELLAPERITRYCAAIDYRIPDPNYVTRMDGSVPLPHEAYKGANLFDATMVVALRGLVAKDAGKLAAAHDAAVPGLAYVNAGDGFYADGSFIQHQRYPYAGTYGQVMMGSLTNLYYLLNDTKWTLAGDPNYLNPYNWAMDTFRSVIYNGVMLDNQRGRKIASQGETGRVDAHQAIVALVRLANMLPRDQSVRLKSVIKGWLERDTMAGPGHAKGDPALRAIVDDAGITAAPEPLESRYFPVTDRAVARGSGFAYTVAMFSPRIGAFESGNGQNLRGWWTSAGATQLLNADQAQYDGNYWATVDPWRLAGTTTDRTGSGTPRPWRFYPNPKATVGGAELGRQFVTSAMDFSMTNVTGSALTGKKAWFLFGDRIVAVGSGVTGNNGAAVETIVENRALNAAGNNKLTVNTVHGAKPVTLGWTEVMPATSWAHLAGNSAAGSDIGYVFPDRPAVTALRDRRNGSWRDVEAGGSSATVSGNYLSLALDHGVNPDAAGYTYIVLPNRSAQQTADFAAANPVTVLERSGAATAVRDNAQGVTGVVFWNDAGKTVYANGAPYLSSDGKAVVTLQEQGSELQLAVADPTQQNTGAIKLELHRAASRIVSADPAITVTRTRPTVRMTVAANGSRGRSFNARFVLDSAAAPSPAYSSLTVRKPTLDSEVSGVAEDRPDTR